MKIKAEKNMAWLPAEKKTRETNSFNCFDKFMSPFRG